MAWEHRRATLLSVEVTLQESADPEIWRRLRVPADIRLDRFHQVLGAAMGWQDSHLHVFEHGSDRYGFPNPDLDIRADREVTLGALLVHPGDRLGYEYDFGDSWQHGIVLEAVLVWEVDVQPSHDTHCTHLAWAIGWL